MVPCVVMIDNDSFEAAVKIESKWLIALEDSKREWFAQHKRDFFLENYYVNEIDRVERDCSV